MNMVFKPRQYLRGERVGYVDLSRLFGPLEVPVEPRCWYILRVFPSREIRVMKEFRRRHISAWLPTITSPQEIRRSKVSYGRRQEWIERKNVTSPMITGGVLLPDFEMYLDRWKEVDGTIGELRFGDYVPSLTPKLMADLRHIEAIGNTPKTKRDRHFEIGQLVRVVDGPFRSFCARVERFDSPGRLSVGVEIFGRITPTELGEGDIEAVEAEGV